MKALAWHFQQLRFMPYCSTPPRSNLRSGPQSGPLSGYANRIGLAQALKKKLTSAHMSGGSPRSSFGSPKSGGGPRSNFGPPKSSLRADAIIEEEEEGRETGIDKITQENTERETHVKDDIPDDDSAKELTEKDWGLGMASFSTWLPTTWHSFKICYSPHEFWLQFPSFSF